MLHNRAKSTSSRFLLTTDYKNPFAGIDNAIVTIPEEEFKGEYDTNERYEKKSTEEYKVGEFPQSDEELKKSRVLDHIHRFIQESSDLGQSMGLRSNPKTMKTTPSQPG